MKSRKESVRLWPDKPIIVEKSYSHRLTSSVYWLKSSEGFYDESFMMMVFLVIVLRIVDGFLLFFLSISLWQCESSKENISVRAVRSEFKMEVRQHGSSYFHGFMVFMYWVQLSWGFGWWWKSGYSAMAILQSILIDRCGKLSTGLAMSFFMSITTYQ